MFGEHESESPRVPSPWDPFLPSPPNGSVSPPHLSALHNGIPKLVPEVEEGNIEYKLKLTQISNARFARLVTQLKWRLLEGGGQAYYELGVADSGALIGLSRADLEESLETLEMMAGEIGASVIVVKEIEVPPTIAALADKDSGYTDPDTGEWTRKMHRRGIPALAYDGSGSGSGGDGLLSSSAPSATETETDFSAAEYTDGDDTTSAFSSSFSTPGAVTPARTWPVTPMAIAHRPTRTNPARPTAQSSPFIAPLDDDLALFSMEPEPAFRDDDILGVVADDEGDLGTTPPVLGLEIAIAAVYKPRPVRHRVRADMGALAVGSGRHGKRYNKHKEKRGHGWQQADAGVGVGVGAVLSKEEKAALRREARDRKREERRAAVVAGTTEGGAQPENAGAEMTEKMDLGSRASAVEGAGLEQEATALAAGVGGLHAEVEGETALEEAAAGVEMGEVVREARLIVEALVVRKLSIEEATLDFGRLALE